MWSHDEYWSKGKLYIRRAQSVERSLDGEEGLYPFWMALALEFIGRAALCKISPVLNADLGGKNPEETIYLALGLGSQQPRTLPLHAVFSRCARFVDGFEKGHQTFCEFMGYQRNEELHSDTAAFENLKLQDWLAKYYGTLDILCKHLEHDLDDLLGEEEADSARTLLTVNEQGMESTVKQSIADHHRDFQAKPDTEQQQLTGRASNRARFGGSSVISDLVDCPACSSEGLVRGREIRSSKPYYEDDCLYTEMTGHAEDFECWACGLRLPTPSHLHWSGIPPQFVVTVETSLHDLQVFDYYHDEYMNE